MLHNNPWPRYETGPRMEPGTSGLAGKCSTTELTLLLTDLLPKLIKLLVDIYIHM